MEKRDDLSGLASRTMERVALNLESGAAIGSVVLVLRAAAAGPDEIGTAGDKILVERSERDTGASSAPASAAAECVIICDVRACDGAMAAEEDVKSRGMLEGPWVLISCAPVLS